MTSTKFLKLEKKVKLDGLVPLAQSCKACNPDLRTPGMGRCALRLLYTASALLVFQKVTGCGFYSCVKFTLSRVLWEKWLRRWRDRQLSDFTEDVSLLHTSWLPYCLHCFSKWLKYTGLIIPFYFQAMIELDGDDVRVSSRGKYAERDIVQVRYLMKIVYFGHCEQLLSVLIHK